VRWRVAASHRRPLEKRSLYAAVRQRRAVGATNAEQTREAATDARSLRVEERGGGGAWGWRLGEGRVSEDRHAGKRWAKKEEGMGAQKRMRV
jgi:hypothetical protein